MGLFDWSKTAASNTTLESVSWAEGMSPANINNGVRAIAAALKKWQEDIGGAVTSSGSANAQTLTTNSTISTYADGQTVVFIAGYSNTGAATLNVDTVAAKSIRLQGDHPLQGGEIQAGGVYAVSHDSSANSSSGGWLLWNPSLVIPWGNGIAPHENLIVKRASASTIDIDADAVTVRNASGHAVRIASINETIDLTASGANGIDTGSEETSTWYHLWVIWNGSTGINALASESSTISTITLPAGYTYAAYVGAIYNDSSGDLRKLIQRGNRVAIDGSTNPPSRAKNNGTDTSYTAIDLSTFIPTTAKTVFLRLGLSTSSGTDTCEIDVSDDGSTTTAGLAGAKYRIGEQGTTANEGGYATIPLSTAQQIDYYVSGTNAQGTIYVLGWEY